MIETDSIIPSASEGPPPAAEAILSAFGLANAALLFAFAMSRDRVATDNPWFGMLANAGMLAQSIGFMLPGVLIGAIAARLNRKLGLAIGFALIAAIPVAIYADYVVANVFRMHIFSHEFFHFPLLLPVLRNFTDYISPAALATLATRFAVYASVQFVLFWTCRMLASRRLRSTARVRSGIALAFALSLFLAWLERQCGDASLRSEVEPLAIFGRERPEPPASMMDEDQSAEVQLLALRGALGRVLDDYDQMHVTARDEGRRPDIVVVILESLRADSIAPDVTPNLSRFSAGAVVSNAHFSCGNSTFLGWMGIFYGLSPIFAQDGRDTIRGLLQRKPALNRLLHEAGYHLAFFGSWSIEGWSGMDAYLNAENFDTFEFLKNHDTLIENDKRILARAHDLLERKNDFRRLRDRPVAMVLQINMTHFGDKGYSSDPEDRKDTPFLPDGAVWMLAQPDGKQLAHNRYRNCLRTMDRLIAPLLDRGAIVVLTGDHGESMGEDGGFGHSGKLSLVQTQTPLLIHAPGRTGRTVSGPTTHLDSRPTILDAAGLVPNNPRPLSGRSLLGDEPSNADGFLLASAAAGTCILVDPTMTEFYSLEWIPWKGRRQSYGAVDRYANPVATTDDAAYSQLFDRYLRRLCGPYYAPPNGDAVATLIDLLQDSDATTRLLATRRLRVAAGAAERALPNLLRVVDSDADANVRREAFETARGMVKK